MFKRKKKVSGLTQEPETKLNQTNNTIISTKKAIQFFNPDSDLEEPEPEEAPEDMQKTPCEMLNFPKIRTELYNRFYFFLHEEEMMEVA